MGLMGHGIIQVAAQAGFDVVGYDAFPGAADKAMERINGSLAKQTGRAVQKGSISEAEAAASVESTVARISHSGDMDALKGCSLVIEAMPEDIALKRKVWTDLQAATAGTDPILATNTSSLQLADMADSTGCPDRFVGLHFFNPVQLMRLVEVVRTDDTSEAAVDVACRFVEAIGKTPVMCKDTPGFVVNRLLVPYMAQVRLRARDSPPRDWSKKPLPLSLFRRLAKPGRPPGEAGSVCVRGTPARRRNP